MPHRWKERLAWCALALPPGLLCYLLTARYSAGASGGRGVPTFLDDWVIFWPPAIWLYCMYYPFPVAVFFAPPSLGDFKRALAYLGIQNLLAYIVFVAFPVFMKRPAVEPVGLSQSMVHFMYNTLDRYPGNCFPSLHVSVSCGTALIVLEHVPSWWWPAAIMAAAISASTVLVKQHYVLDVVSGLFVAVTTWWIFYRVRRVREWAPFMQK